MSFPAQIVDGKLWFQLDCGSGPGILGISGRAVNDGSWHSVFLELNRNFTSLSLDDSYVERRRAPLYFQKLSTESTIYFGALVQADNIRSLTDTRVTQVLSGFQGCLDSVVLNNNELPLQNKRSSFAEVVGLTELKLGCVLYPDACERSPCQHGGSCTGLPSGGECAAPRAPWYQGRRGVEDLRGPCCHMHDRPECPPREEEYSPKMPAELPYSSFVSCRAWQLQRRLVYPTPQAQRRDCRSPEMVLQLPRPPSTPQPSRPQQLGGLGPPFKCLLLHATAE